MVKSILIICDQSPIGKNSTAESLRFASGLISLSDLDLKVIFRDDAVYFFNKNADPEAVNQDNNENIMRLIKLSDLHVFLLKDSLEERGLKKDDLIQYENLYIISLVEVANFIQNSEVSLRF
ncbi:MAG: DsrE family protein [Promethearchaeota archaeon]